jgi:hypothetical protein
MVSVQRAMARSTLEEMPATPLIDVLCFEGCPNHEKAVALVERVASQLGLGANIEVTEVRDVEAAQEHRFLGSPTVRIDGHDVEPGAEERADYVHACRIYRGEHGFSGQPDERWVRDALMKAMS